MFRSMASVTAAGLCLVAQAFPQTAAKVDFARDVQPIFRQNCYGCHGSKVQSNGLRLDRRSSVFKPGARRVMPGSLENSFLYRRLSGTSTGLQMPPTGALHAEQIQTIKAWIEQGAEWPDALANEVDLPPLNPNAIALVEILRAAERREFEKMAGKNPSLLNARGPEGSTPFMYAVLYCDAPALERLIKKGADPNKRNDAGATALMWAAIDAEKTHVLLAHGADVDAKSDEARTALMIAAGHPGGAPVVKELLARGANPNPNPNPLAESSPLLEASLAGDAESLQVLLEHGASVKDIAGFAIANAAGAGCRKCIDLLMARDIDAMQYTIALQQVVVLDDPKLTRMMIEHGADVNAADPNGRTALQYAAVSDLQPVEQVKMLITKGANVGAKSQHASSGDSGRTALELARMHGNSSLVELLMKAGSTTEIAATLQPAAIRSGNTIASAVSRSLPLLQRTDASFMPKAGCFSCHNQSLVAMAVGLARTRGFTVDEPIASRQVSANAGALSGARDILHQGFLVPGINANPDILGYALMGLAAEGYKPDLTTDTVAMYLKAQQMPNGHWASGPGARPPLCSDLAQTVVAMRGLQLYAPPVDKAGYADVVHRAGVWIGEYRARTNYDLAWRLLGMVWGGQSKDAVLQARRELLALQRADGGWADLVSMESGAYTSGLALMALASSGLPVSDPGYQRGVQYLLSTQLEDGSWYVQSRAAGFQPYFDNGFPHGVDQWISAAGTSFATIALTMAAPPSDNSTRAAALQEPAPAGLTQWR